MKMVKSLILGSAAGLIAMSGAQAADLPVKAKAVEYVRICSLYGAGFFYIPGTDTCIKLGGYLRVDTTFNGNVYDGPAWNEQNGAKTRFAHAFQSRSRMALTVDTRTATEYGVVRTFGQGDFQFSTFGTRGGIQPANVLGAIADGTAGALNNDGAGNGYVAVEMVFLQFAGFTFGKSASAYATPWHGYPGNNTSFLLGGHDTVTGVNNIQYTMQFGNGVSGTIGLDEGIVFNRTSIANTSNGVNAVGGQGNVYGGQKAPDIVGNIRVDQAWGLFQLSGAAHLVNPAYYGTNPNVLSSLGAPFPGIPASSGSELSGHPDSKWGGSVMAALQIKNLPTGAGDDIKIDASYSRGNTKNVISTSAASPSFAMFSGTGLAGAYQSVGFGYTSDAVFGGTNGLLPTATQLQLTTAYGVRGAFNHNWDPYWSTSLFGSYSAVRYNDTAKALLCAQYTTRNAAAGVAAGPVAIATSADFSCNPDFNVAQVGLVTRWTPVKNLTFSAEMLYINLDQKFTGSATLSPGGTKPAASVYEYKDQSNLSFNVRAQRNF